MNLLIIGASSDIAMATIIRLESKYEYIIATYRKNNKQFDKMCNIYKNLIPIQVDLMDQDSIQELISTMLEKDIIPTHILHCAAPQCENQHFHKMENSIIYESLQVGVLSLCQITKPFLYEMSKRREGKIVVILSDVIKNLVPFCSQYIISKYAMLGYVKALAAEYGGKNIQINGISPGWTDTKYINNQSSLLIEKKIEDSRYKRLYKPEEIAGIIDFVLSNQNACINGENIFLDELYEDIKL